jgi:PAS domain-containing protein
VTITYLTDFTSEQALATVRKLPAMLMVTRTGTIVLVNAHVERLFGYRREELIYRGWRLHNRPWRAATERGEHRMNFTRTPPRSRVWSRSKVMSAMRRCASFSSSPCGGERLAKLPTVVIPTARPVARTPHDPRQPRPH